VAGRPSKLTEEMAKRILASFRQGDRLIEAAARQGVGKATLFSWLKRLEDPTLRDLLVADAIHGDFFFARERKIFREFRQQAGFDLFAAGFPLIKSRAANTRSDSGVGDIAGLPLVRDNAVKEFARRFGPKGHAKEATTENGTRRKNLYGGRRLRARLADPFPSFRPPILAIDVS
jgi:hypothetical protein